MKNDLIKRFVPILAVVLFLASDARGDELLCLNGASLSEDANLCECKVGLFYNAIEGQCQDLCDFYGDGLCGYDSNAYCETLNSTDFSCACLPGFTEESDGSCTGAVTETDCPSGLVLYQNDCVDPCDSEIRSSCPIGMTCLVDENTVAACDCLLRCRMKSPAIIFTLSVYSVSLDMPDYSFPSLENVTGSSLYALTKSFESIFGLGNAELIDVTEYSLGSTLKMEVAVSEPLENLSDLEDIILSYCWPSDEDVDECFLPSAILINMNSLEVSNSYPCSNDPLLCAPLNAECVEDVAGLPDGNYRCLCNDGYKQDTNIDEFYCTDTNECVSSILCGEDYGFFCQNIPGDYQCEECCDGETADLQTELYELNEEEDSLLHSRYVAEIDLQDQEIRTTVILSVLGGILALAVIVCGFSLFYLWRLRRLG